MTDRDAKTRALDALRAWRVLDDDRDRLVAAAFRAEASQTEIAAITGLHRNTVKTILESQGAAMSTQTATTTDPLAPWHHPHLVSYTVSDADFRDMTFEWRPFTGAEDEPADYGDISRDGSLDHLSFEQGHVIFNEYRQARALWALAKFRSDAREQLEAAAPVWDAYTGARSVMDALFDQYRTLPDDRWQSQTLRLIEAHDQTKAAAAAWDATAEALAEFQLDYRQKWKSSYEFSLVGGELTLADAAAAIGLDITAWPIGHLSDYRDTTFTNGDAYRRKTPLAEAARAEAERQLASLRRVRQALATAPEGGAQ